MIDEKRALDLMEKIAPDLIELYSVWDRKVAISRHVQVEFRGEKYAVWMDCRAEGGPDMSIKFHATAGF